jgi:hypothetical protein
MKLNDSPDEDTAGLNAPSPPVQFLGGSSDTGFDCFPRASLKIKEKRPDRTAAKIAQEPKMNYCLLAFYCLYSC